MINTQEIIDYLNMKTGKHFRNTKSNKSYINGRMNEGVGYKVSDFKHVIDIKCKQWLTDSKMCGYLRPSTLFCAKHFDSYLNEEPKKLSVESLSNEQLKQLWENVDYFRDWYKEIGKLTGQSYKELRSNERLLSLEKKFN